MFKKVFQIVTAFSLLVGAYSGYVQAFAVVAKFFGARPQAVASIVKRQSKTEKQALRLAGLAFGPTHWAADKNLSFRYYNHEHGYWMYAKEYKRLKDGKQLRFRPFALIWLSRDGTAMKRVTSEEAIVDLDQPLGLSNSSGPMKVVHARLEGDVRILDDKGTIDDPSDDLAIGPIPHMEYDAKTLQVRSESTVVIQDRTMRIVGDDMMIQLRPKDETTPSGDSGGFDGAKNAFLYRNVHIIMSNAGSSGMLPGKAKPEQEDPNGKTPIDLRCAGMMQVDLPKPRQTLYPAKVGPPTSAAPPLPTMVYFSRDVVVMRGKVGEIPDQLNSDTLDLTLLPAPHAEGAGAEKPKGARRPKPAPGQAPATPPGENGKPAASAAVAALTAAPTPTLAPAAGDGTASELALHKAVAKGHAVWLQSRAQGSTVRCNELIHEKLLPAAPDKTYLRADGIGKLWIEKLDIAAEGPDKGKITQVTTIRGQDSTIYDDGKGNNDSTVVVRGPGILETRPARDKAVERTALWRDSMVLQTENRPNKQQVKRVTLNGRPKFIDPAQATLDAEDTIFVWLKPKAKQAKPQVGPAAETTALVSRDGGPAAPLQADRNAPGTPPRDGEKKPAKAQGGTANESFEIEKLIAIREVHLNAPPKVIYARERLDALFEPAPVTATAPPTSGNNNTRTASAPAPASAPAASPTEPVFVADNGNAQPANGQPASPTAPGNATDAAKPKAAEKPHEAAVDVKANRVWTLIWMHPPEETAGKPRPASSTPGAGGRSEIQTAMLRGNVSFHQDPEPGKKKGTDVTGEAIDVANLGDGKSKFQVDYQEKPDEVVPAALLKLIPHARVSNDEMTITGPKIGLNQATDQAWVLGPGTLTQMAKKGLLTEKGVGEKPVKPGQKAAPKRAEGPMTIAWKTRMDFAGRGADPEGQTVARAFFFGDVDAVTDDAHLTCKNRMETYFDRTIVLVRPKKEAKPVNDEPEPKPEISIIRCYDDVRIVSRKRDPISGILLQQQRIQGAVVYYDKPTGDFEVPGAGRTMLWNREAEDGAKSTGDGLTPTQHVVAVAPTGPSPNPATGTSTRRPSAVVGHNTGLRPETVRPGTTKLPKKLELPPLKLTQVDFTQGMKGRYIAGQEETEAAEPRWADFFGDVRAINAKVTDEKSSLDFDRPTEDAMRLTSQCLRVVNEPSANPAVPARNFLKAWDEAYARTITETIAADVITYDSSKELFYATANEGHEVVIAQATSPGQPASIGHNRAVRYNRKTGESELVHPREMQLVDAKTGTRPTAVKEGKIQAPKSIRPKPLIPGRSTIERRGMTGH